MEMTKVAPLEVTMPHQLPAEGSTTAGKKALAGSALALVLCTPHKYFAPTREGNNGNGKNAITIFF